MVALTRSATSSRSSEAEPKFLTPRTPSRPTFGHETIRIAEALGQPPMPWQQHWMLVTGEMVQDEATGIWVPAYSEAFATLMRQNGKTLWVLAHELQRATLWEAYDGKPQSIAYSGQTGLMARQKFRKEHWPMIKQSPMRRFVERPRFDAGDTGLNFANDAILTIWGSSEDAGHSLTVDLVAMDEIWADVDDRREQAALPAMATRADGQKILASTAGTEKSTLYLRKQAAGRSAVLSGQVSGMAYLEFAFDRDDDPEDPATWWRNMPALGHTITERTVRAALEQMKKEDGDLTEFQRAWGNLTKQTGGDRVFPEGMWNAVCRDALLAGNLVVAADAQPDLSSASIAVASDAGVAEVQMHAAGSSWLLGELETAYRSLKVPVVIDELGPVGHLIPQLEKRNVRVVGFNGRQVAQSCALFYERVADRRIRVRPNRCDHCGVVPITAAVEGASRQPLGDGWKWSRKSESVDISPLMAVSLAVGASNGVGGDTGSRAPLFAVT